MAKLLLLIFIGGVVYWWWRNQQAGERTIAATKPVENMVRCQQCGVYLPQSDACGDAAAWFCCAEHEREFQTKTKD